MYHTKQNKFIVVATIIITTLPSSISASFAQSTPRISRNEYDIKFSQHPIKIKLEADVLKVLTKINPTVTFDINLNIKWETACTIAGAAGSVITINGCQSDDPYRIATKAAMSAALLLAPHLYNYMIRANTPELSNENQE